MGTDDQLFAQRFELSWTKKQLERDSRQCSKAERKELRALKKAIATNEVDKARICAANAIRHKTTAVTMQRLASRVEAVSDRLVEAATMNRLTTSLGTVVARLTRGLGGSTSTKLASTLDAFEEAFDDMEVHAACVETTLGASCTTRTPAGEVDALIAQVASEHTLHLEFALPVVTAGACVAVAPLVDVVAPPDTDDALWVRLDALQRP
jgi:charged multivesicular body protein 1